MKVNLSIAKVSNVRVVPGCDAKLSESNSGILYRSY